METKNYTSVIGTNPENIISAEVQQQYNDSCAIKSQQLVLNDFGKPVTEDQLVQQAETLNIYHPGQGGTSPEDVGKLLELNGIPCTQHMNASVYDLTSALAKGEKIIVGVDSSELWRGNFATDINDIIYGEQADHALIVAGIDTTDPENVQVILTDPGTGQEGARYPIAQFIDAWNDSGNFMVTTDFPAPLAYNPEMINFNYDTGHLSTIGHLPYDYFEQTIMPLSSLFENDFNIMDSLYNDFMDIIQGNAFEISSAMDTPLDYLNIVDINNSQQDATIIDEENGDSYNDFNNQELFPFNENSDDETMHSETAHIHNYHNHITFDLND